MGYTIETDHDSGLRYVTGSDGRTRRLFRLDGFATHDSTIRPFMVKPSGALIPIFDETPSGGHSEELVLDVPQDQVLPLALHLIQLHERYDRGEAE